MFGVFDWQAAEAGRLSNDRAEAQRLANEGAALKNDLFASTMDAKREQEFASLGRMQIDNDMLRESNPFKVADLARKERSAQATTDPVIDLFRDNPDLVTTAAESKARAGIAGNDLFKTRADLENDIKRLTRDDALHTAVTNAKKDGAAAELALNRAQWALADLPAEQQIAHLTRANKLADLEFEAKNAPAEKQAALQAKITKLRNEVHASEAEAAGSKMAALFTSGNMAGLNDALSKYDLGITLARDGSDVVITNRDGTSYKEDAAVFMAKLPALVGGKMTSGVVSQILRHSATDNRIAAAAAAREDTQQHTSDMIDKRGANAAATAARKSAGTAPAAINPAIGSIPQPGY